MRNVTIERAKAQRIADAFEDLEKNHGMVFVEETVDIKQALATPVQEPVAYWIPKAEQFCIAAPSGRPFAKAWEPLYTTPPAAQPAPVQEPVVDAMARYLRVCSSGGMPKKLQESVQNLVYDAERLGYFKAATPPAQPAPTMQEEGK